MYHICLMAVLGESKLTMLPQVLTLDQPVYTRLQLIDFDNTNPANLYLHIGTAMPLPFRAT